MQTFSDFLSADHGACDDLFARVEKAVADGDWSTAATGHTAFINAMERHLGMEEQVLFPAFEEATGSPMGPTQVMRHEHTQMRQLFSDMGQALGGRDADEYLGAAETLLILMQQHNAKEEQILYPMSDQVLGGQREALFRQMEAIRSAA